MVMDQDELSNRATADRIRKIQNGVPASEVYAKWIDKSQPASFWQREDEKVLVWAYLAIDRMVMCRPEDRPPSPDGGECDWA